ncbi:DUF3825 domain-containing protein [Romeria aff. gracilis LEGE 07310]|uniref:DUF3825 domain-containing protein n=1 Tax=Vasconcelosia minhoensis LEGE 07310 TaxID=915328 RepID=A0A8J7DS99_9CYAN|nr:DUF3825 domain-containing protein [Romeria gracilis]MBE9079864.1 DUF3825 domain-containing protein [Romeria aff. gracilis LEGE 07310]
MREAPPVAPPIAHADETGPAVSPKLRKTLYQTFYDLHQDGGWVNLAPLGNALKQQDPQFSAEKYGFTKLSQLLENVPDLVELDRANSQARLNAPADVKGLLVKAFSRISSDDGWIDLSSVGQQVNQLNADFSAPKYGFLKFREFIQSRPELIELRKDDSVYPSRYFARLRSQPARRAKPANSPKTRFKPRQPVRLLSYAFFPSLNSALDRLAALTLPEQWYFGVNPPKRFQHPVLKNYLEYTFIRLQYEGKVAVSTNEYYSAFNTGLVDRKYEPIYVLFGQDRQDHNQNWYLIDCCILGEGREGKTLADQFGPLQKANYFDQPADLFYDSHAGVPQVDWRHIVQDNPNRLPLRFLQNYCPHGFTPQDVMGMSLTALADYKQQFAEALSADPQAYRAIVDRCDSALRFALLKTELNYRTAIPYYSPRKNRLQLLLPLSLVSDDTVDCALVVDRSASKSRYIGYTILPLSWAYSNARLVSRLEDPWLGSSLDSSADDTDLDPESEPDDEED